MREAEFKDWMRNHGYAERTINTCASDARRVERDENLDLDEEFEKDGLKGLIRLYNPTKQDEREGNVPKMKIVSKDKNKSLSELLSGYRSTLSNYYKRFCEADGDFVYEASDNNTVTDTGAVFGLEKDLQAALREHIDQLESGLEIVDGGVERSVDSGRIDILAKDGKGTFVIIELKAGTATDSVVAQILGYMGDIAEEENAAVRGIIVAAEFNKRVQSASRATSNLELKTYRYNFEFN